ncbi:hypothetical protein niasHS_016735 [Heterodera schachtii]|uniref:ANK_REP_REGION domain-containing protein n=1 Tax=Heterodera schachtii TaxID=97005 RepID=A0ABD2HWU0_HETSC
MEAGIDAEDNDGNTLLMLAVMNQHTQIVRYFISKGARVDLTNKDGMCALHYCAGFDSDDGFELCKLLLDNGANANQTDGIDHGITPLHIACGQGALKNVKFFVEQCGGDIEFANSYGYSAIFYAVMEEQFDVVQYLVSKGTRIDQINHKGRSPLIAACLFGHLQIVKFLVENGGADIEIVASDGLTAVRAAIIKNRFEILEYLLEKGARTDYLLIKLAFPI